MRKYFPGTRASNCRASTSPEDRKKIGKVKDKHVGIEVDENVQYAAFFRKENGPSDV
jgi:hypothetical protein